METKICTKCTKEKNIDDFFWRNKKNNTRHAQCKDCYRSSRDNQAYYQRTKAEHIKRAKVRSKANFLETRKRIWAYLLEHPCVDCQNDNPIVLDFDHRDETEKSHTISKMVRNGFSWEKIEAEISKCDVRCSNCHRIRTAKQFGYYTYVE